MARREKEKKKKKVEIMFELIEKYKILNKIKKIWFELSVNGVKSTKKKKLSSQTSKH